MQHATLVLTSQTPNTDLAMRVPPRSKVFLAVTALPAATACPALTSIVNVAVRVQVFRVAERREPSAAAIPDPPMSPF